MRKQARLTLILSFHTTAAAMETERVCAAAGIPGRLLPAPRQLTADCGIAWASDPADRPRLEALASEGAIEPATFDELLL
ncbi:MAG: DUF3343 domain-containing protein [Oscillospiraceae bacterium]|nr:DUF3343 domain-containing protein [Oscillospiraceae bacterium]